MSTGAGGDDSAANRETVHGRSAVKLIQTARPWLGGFVGAGVPEGLLRAVEERFLARNTPTADRRLRGRQGDGARAGSTTWP